MKIKTIEPLIHEIESNNEGLNKKFKETIQSEFISEVSFTEAHEIALTYLVNIAGEARKKLGIVETYTTDDLKYSLFRNFETLEGGLFLIGCDIERPEKYRLDYDRDEEFRLRFIQRTNLKSLYNILRNYKFKEKELGVLQK